MWLATPLVILANSLIVTRSPLGPPETYLEIGAVQSKELWATEATGMNDVAEVRQGWSCIRSWLEDQADDDVTRSCAEWRWGIPAIPGLTSTVARKGS